MPTLLLPHILSVASIHLGQLLTLVPERECYNEDTKCWISFGINTNDGSKPTLCSYESNGSKAPYAQVACGDFMVGSTWSGQFGPSEGFTTLSVVRDGQIIWPAYKDTQLIDWVAVKPDQSYTPAKLP